MTPKDWDRNEAAIKAAKEEILAAIGEKSVVKSIQRGIIKVPVNTRIARATIDNVNMNKSVVLYGGSMDSNNGGEDIPGAWLSMVELESSTTVKATKEYTERYASLVPYQVIEFY